MADRDGWKNAMNPLQNETALSVPFAAASAH